MRDIDQAQVLLSLARDDWCALQHMLNPKHFSDAIFGFHVQQAVEKSIKAWIALQGLSYPKTHDIDQLLLIMENAAMHVDGLRHWAQLTPFAVQFRYSILDGEDIPLPRQTLLNQVAELLTTVEGLLHQTGGEND